MLRGDQQWDKWNGQEWMPSKFHVKTRKNSVVTLCSDQTLNRLPREGAEFPSLEVFQSQLDTSLSRGVGLDDPSDPLRSDPFHQLPPAPHCTYLAEKLLLPPHLDLLLLVLRSSLGACARSDPQRHRSRSLIVGAVGPARALGAGERRRRRPRQERPGRRDPLDTDPAGKERSVRAVRASGGGPGPGRCSP